MSINGGPEVFQYIIQPEDSLWELADEFHTTQEDIMNCQADCAPQCMGDCRAQGELTDSECMQQCSQICVDSCRPQ